MLANPWIILAAVLAFLGFGATGYYFGGKHKADSIAAQEVRDRELLDKVALETAAAIAGIEIKNTTIRQKVETVTREVPVYRDCQHSPDVVGLLNDALAGGSLPTGDRKLPEADPAR